MSTDGDLPPAANAARFDARKAKRAAQHPQRPGERCAAVPSSYMPLVDRTRCEGKRDCEAVCPFDVFEVRRIDDDEYQQLPAVVRFKLWIHARNTAYTPRTDACQACGLCVVACPEHAISLVKTAS